jgi:DNA-binding response OmpR family regulator
MRLLYAEDEGAMADAVADILTFHNYNVEVVDNGEDALACAREGGYDGIILDIMLPKMDGLAVLREVRRMGDSTPVLLLTARSDVADRIEGLDLGADDYVTKPYRVKELLSRISAILRREERIRRMADAVKAAQDSSESVSCGTGASDNSGVADEFRNFNNVGVVEEYTFGSHLLNVSEFRLYRNGEVVECTPSEIRLLREFLRNSGIALTRNQLIERLYDTENSYIDDNTLSVYIKRLRDKLGDDAAYIQTIKGVGYRFAEE